MAGPVIDDGNSEDAPAGALPDHGSDEGKLVYAISAIPSHFP
jgi:hypothetical protein